MSWCGCDICGGKFMSCCGAIDVLQLHLMVCAVTDVADMDMKENILDHMIQNCTRQLRMLTEDSENARYPLNFLCCCPSLPG